MFESFDNVEPIFLGQAMQDQRESLNLNMSMICCHVASELNREHQLMIERLVEQLHVPPCPNNQVRI